MNRKGIHSMLMALAMAIFFLPTLELTAQVSSSAGTTRGNTVRLQKDVPIRKLPQIKGVGQPTELYVVQLSRFEDMDAFPSQFPKNTFLVASTDHINEKFLFAGYYESFQEAKAAAAKWRKDPMFKGAFARPTPFIVRYD